MTKIELSNALQKSADVIQGLNQQINIAIEMAKDAKMHLIGGQRDNADKCIATIINIKDK